MFGMCDDEGCWRNCSGVMRDNARELTKAGVGMYLRTECGKGQVRWGWGRMGVGAGAVWGNGEGARLGEELVRCGYVLNPVKDGLRRRQGCYREGGKLS